MTKLLISMVSAGALAAGLAIAAAPAAAQESIQIAEIIVYGTDPCPRSTDSEVVVCARKPEAERYRIPERLRSTGSRQSRESWAARAKSFEYVGRSGIMSCSAVGPGGYTGCLQNMISRATSERGEEVAAEAPPPEE